MAAVFTEITASSTAYYVYFKTPGDKYYETVTFKLSGSSRFVYFSFNALP